MARPTERLEASTERASTHAMLRLLVVYASFGFIGLLETGLRWGVFSATDPGDGSGPLASTVAQISSNVYAESWLISIVLIALLGLALETAMVVWSVRRGARSESPELLLALGLGGVLAHGFNWFLTLASTAWGARAGAERVAAQGIAMSLGGTASAVLQIVLVVAGLIWLFLRVRAAEERVARLDDDGGYRDPAG